MAFSRDGLAKVSTSQNRNANTVWVYTSSADALATIVASGYFNAATRELRRNDIIHIVDSANTASLTFVTSASLAATVTVNPPIEQSQGASVTDWAAATAVAFSKTIAAHAGATAASHAGITVTSADDPINNLIDWRNRNGVLSGEPGVVDGSDVTTKVRMNAAIRYQIDGELYRAGATEAVLEGAGDDIEANKFGAWRIELSKLGVLTTQSAVTSGNMTFDSAEDAMMNLCSQARTADTIDVGYLVIEAAAGGFTIGTDLPLTGDAQVTAATYTDAFVQQYGSGLNAALGSATLTPNGVTTLNRGSVDVDINGAKLAQIAADATMAFDDADTVAVNTFGGWMMISDHAGTGVYMLASDGVAGSVSAMSHATLAAANTALDTLQDLLPLTMSPLARVFFENTADGSVPATWTAGTDDWDDSVIVAANAGTVTDYGIVHDLSDRETFSVIQPTVTQSRIVTDVGGLITQTDALVVDVAGLITQTDAANTDIASIRAEEVKELADTELGRVATNLVITRLEAAGIIAAN